MDDQALRQLVADVASGACDPDEAVRRLKRLPYADLGFARVDHHREVRQGMPEAIYGPGKSPSQVAGIVLELLHGSTAPVLLTRADAAQAEAAERAATGAGFPSPKVVPGPLAAARVPTHQLLMWRPAERRDAHVTVVTAGTADLPVAEECAAVLEALGMPPDVVTDCGVAGLHRLLADLDRITVADAVVVVAGMEGALASVIGGLVAAPVVAVPTSVGYGSGLEGVTALLAMLASCASGLTVVGIDNGFGAACAVSRMLP